MTPEQEAQVRRVLGSLPPEAPVPPEVAARLDSTLAGLVAERGATPDSGSRPPAVTPGGTPDELSARRRRRRATGLVAAAGLAVLGVGLGTVLDDLSLGGRADEATVGAAQDSGAREAAPEPMPQGSAGGALAVPDGVEYLTADRQDLSSSTLARDVSRAAALTPVRTAREGVTEDRTGPDGDTRALAALAPCAVPASFPGDRLVPVRLDGEPATLVLRKAVSGTRDAQIYSCDDPGALLASTAVPAG